MSGRVIVKSEVGHDLPPGHGSLQLMAARRRSRTPWLRIALGLATTVAGIMIGLGWQA
jgi:hypothetical protein